MSFINLIGLAANDPVPGNYVQIDFGVGPVAGFQGAYTALLIGGKLAAGTAVADTTFYGPDTAIPMATEGDVIVLFGAGSEVHRMWLRFTAVNKTTPLYAIAVSEGGSAVAATGTITITGTATSGGAHRIWVGDRFVDSGFATGDTPTVQAQNAVLAINAMLGTPVLATNSSGVITITTLQKGLRANFVRFMAQVRPSTSGVTITPTASTACAGGSVTDSSTTALANIISQTFYYIVSAAEDQTQLTALATQLGNQALPITGILQSFYAGSADTLSNAITITTALNTARGEIQWLFQSDAPPCELAANAAAVAALFEAPAVPRVNFNGFGSDAVTQASWVIRAPLSGAAPTRPQIASALNSGLSPIQVLRSGTTMLVKRATTRWYNGSTSTVDYRIRAPHKRLICDRYANDWKAKQNSQFPGKTIVNDPVGNEPDPGGNMSVAPRQMTAAANGLTDDYGANGLLQNVSAIKAGTFSARETNPTTRMSTYIPLQTIDLFDSGATLIQQVA